MALASVSRYSFRHSYGYDMPYSSASFTRRTMGMPALPRRMSQLPAQKGLDEVVGWGGRREGAGRPKGKWPKVAHLRRAEHKRHVPVHVTLRRERGLPSLREERPHNLLKEVVRSSQREGFRIVHYSVQADHVHLIVEAETKALLASGMRAFAIRAARRFNRDVLRRRRGRVWGDRYHRHDLATPPEVRHALVYVLANGVKHRQVEPGELDPCSIRARRRRGSRATSGITPERSRVGPALVVVDLPA